MVNQAVVFWELYILAGKSEVIFNRIMKAIFLKLISIQTSSNFKLNIKVKGKKILVTGHWPK